MFGHKKGKNKTKQDKNEKNSAHNYQGWKSTLSPNGNYSLKEAVEIIWGDPEKIAAKLDQLLDSKKAWGKKQFVF